VQRHPDPTQALLIICLLAGHLFLRTKWRRGLLLVAAIPVLIIKNGIRIATLTLLAIHVDPSFLAGNLHREGGFIFFALGMLILLPILWWLQKKRNAPARPQQTTCRRRRIGNAFCRKSPFALKAC